VTAVVLDASAGAEIVVRSALGRRLLALAPRDRTWWVPDHFHVECAGALRRMLLKGVIDEVRASAAVGRLLSLPVTVARSQLLIAEAWTLRNNLIVHDAVYVVLAKHLGAPVLTGDRKMAGAPNLPVPVLHIS
jgi:predicted nucleic acid-binding protein